MPPDTTRNPSHDEVKNLLFAATDLPAGDREEFLDRSCRGNQALRAEVESLLESYSETDGFLERPLELERPEPPAVECPKKIGAYRILRLLGFGGMGVVYLAEQESPCREVALKVLRQSASTAEAEQRFTREARLLARFNHPGIASVFEAGVAPTEVGERPFFSMEYVNGVTITEFARGQKLGQRAIVTLFLQVLDAVDHAHQSGVLHRDIKPGNVLVTADGETKVLDFGVAHSMLQEEGSTLLTGTGQLIGTVAYMSPEQARGATLDEHSDQFALGVLLYEMLTGELPYDTRGRLVHDALALLAEGQWKPPSQHDASLRGDLETVLATALATEPPRRYRDLKALRQDLVAWLGGRTIAARPPSTAYQVRRFIARNRLLSAATVLVLLALGVGFGIAATAVARADEDSATAALFRDKEMLDRLLREQQTLWPTSMQRAPQFASWIQRAEDLRTREADYQREADRYERALSANTGTPTLRLRAAIASELATRLSDSVDGGGPLRVMRERQKQMRERYRASIENSVQSWVACARRVREDARFDGLKLPPQEGLIPLGPDPNSGLEEFALLGTGLTPERDAHTGTLSYRLNSALVLVLIPGGEALIGAQATTDVAPGYDPAAALPGRTNDNEGPPFRITLEPFLLSKYEMTQSQWERSFGSNPSDWEIGSTIAGHRITGLHPVEGLDYLGFRDRLRRIGLQLPTEAQWEWAARGGTQTPQAYDSVHGAANLKFGALEGELPTYPADWVDGFGHVHAPVGSFAANPYGLHDILGNVWEYCLDIYKVDYHIRYHRASDGLIVARVDGDYSRRGGCFYTYPRATRIATRRMRRAGSGSSDTGVRPARKLHLD